MSNWWHDLSGDMSNWWHDLSGGNQAEWATVAITLLTALIALLALIFARNAARSGHKAAQISQQMWRLEQEREAKRDERDAQRAQRDARAEQADYVAAWPKRRQRDGGLPYWGAVIHNESKLPIYNLWVDYIDAETDTVRERLGFEVFPPGRRFIPPPDDPDGKPTTTTLDWVRVALEFRDTADRTWRRDRWGWLEQIGTSESGAEEETSVLDVLDE